MSRDTAPRRMAIFDIGKTNARVVLADLAERRDLAMAQRPSKVLEGPPYPHLDVDGLAEFLLTTLGQWQAEALLDGILAVGHGATFGLVAGDALVLPILDYDHSGPEEIAEEYDRQRPPFAETGSPRMPGGLNIGAQLQWLEARFPAEVARADHALFWPQYWTWRLSGAAVTEISYATGHTDLWSIHSGEPATERARTLFPPLSPATEIAGRLKPDLAKRYGLPDDLPIHTGIHDSSLALAPYAAADEETPCTVLSTGTWVTAFALGARELPQAEGDGIMVSLDAQARPVPNMRRMTGRAFAELRAGDADGLPLRSTAACRIDGDGTSFRLVDRESGIPVALDPGTGSRDNALGAVIAHDAMAGMRAIGARGPVHLSGPFGGNDGFVRTLEAHWDAPVRVLPYEAGLTEQVADLFALRPRSRQMP
ncbi:carbohydrate kinase of FGGY family protein [Palleronia aestuarii]|uniref:Carbohydrate kinase of FGGY family protein n=1 Tax=Palleronia aestuarii TaxID=568105 RepID=A0A2W7N0Z4_9RHOB|nr:FGGY family carbohydrate kinase [Palleronia aestuarii]PZX13750.1 carbohydrate kinase of FGGY family protein [Palleronia aestuarii]